MKEKYKIGNWNEMEFQPGRSGTKRALIGTELDDFSVMINVLLPGHELAPEHSHPDEQMSVVLQGELDFYTDGESHKMKAGSWIAVGSDVGHRTHVTGKNPAIIMDIFCPARPKFIEAYKSFLAEMGK